MLVEHLTEAQKRAYIIADNRLALDAGWDEEMLRVEFAELADDGFNLELTGFELGEITNINLDGESLTNDDDFKEVDIEQMECICPKCGFEFDNK